MDDKEDEHKCDICNKIYSSYKTLWTHNKNFHKIIDIIDNNKPNVSISKP